MDIQLNFINQSADANNSQIVVFQKNVAAGYEELAVAWKVIEHCGFGDNHPFVYPMTMQVSASDSYGNYTPKLDAQPGNAFQVTLTTSGDMLNRSGLSNYPTEVQLSNNLPQARSTPTSTRAVRCSRPSRRSRPARWRRSSSCRRSGSARSRR
ncbi:hypothetical protein [uncultured Sphingomonas sp.]|uniref:hypothetical protein n=1 Tax=uncultured Sphingomonas sp. TaxID=158754 RepID=UPI00260E305B|nr:hypothetical protein [uncultured Sphingomonas sp.]